MKAEVTAENKPDYARPPVSICIGYRSILLTHKNKSSVQVFIVFLLETAIVLLHFALELIVEVHS